MLTHKKKHDYLFITSVVPVLYNFVSLQSADDVLAASSLQYCHFLCFAQQPVVFSELNR